MQKRLVYEEMDLGPEATNPDNLVRSGEFLYTVNNKDWSGASISKVAIDLSENVTVEFGKRVYRLWHFCPARGQNGLSDFNGDLIERV